MKAGSSRVRRFGSGAVGLAIAGMVAALLAVAPAAFAESAIKRVGGACEAVAPDIWAWVDSQGEVPSALAGSWTVTGGSIGAAPIAKDELWVESRLEGETVLVEEFFRGEDIAYLSLTGLDAATGELVSLWSSADGSCTQLRGAFDSSQGGETVSRRMSSGPGGVDLALDYLRTAPDERPSQCISSCKPCSSRPNSTVCCSGSCGRKGACGGDGLPNGSSCSTAGECCSGSCTGGRCG